MSYKILENNAVDNTNIEGAVFNKFVAGKKSGIIEFANNCSLSATGNVLIISTGILMLSGVRVRLTAPESFTVTSAPVVDTRYQVIAQLINTDGENFGFSVFIQDILPLVQNDIVADAGVYQLELGRFTHTTTGEIDDVIRTADILTAGSSGGADFEIGEVITEMLSEGLDAEVDIEKRQVDNKTFIDFSFGIPEGVNISTTMPISSAAASNEKVYSEKLAFDQLALKAPTNNPTFTGTQTSNGHIIGSYRLVPTGNNTNYFKFATITIGAGGACRIDGTISFHPYAGDGYVESANISIAARGGALEVDITGYAKNSLISRMGTLYATYTSDYTLTLYYKQGGIYTAPRFTITGGYTYGTILYEFLTAPTDTGSASNPSTPSGGIAKQFVYTDYKQLATTKNPTFTGTVTIPTPVNCTDAANKAYVDSIAISGLVKQPDKTYVLYHATAGTNNLYLSTATYEHNYAAAGAYLITISGTGSSATVDWGDGTSGTVDFTGGFYINNQADKDKYIEVYLGTNCAVIGERAFYGCYGLTSVTIPDSVTNIGNRAFMDCTKLTSITIPDSVTNIGNRAFMDCTKLTSITIPDSVTSISAEAFRNCTGLTSVTIGNSVTSISSSTFRNCTKLTSITIPNSVTGIVAFAFEGCSGLTSINFMGSTLPTIDSSAFSSCRIADIIAGTSSLADSAATAITTAGGKLLTNYRKLY